MTVAAVNSSLSRVRQIASDNAPLERPCLWGGKGFSAFRRLILSKNNKVLVAVLYYVILVFK